MSISGFYQGFVIGDLRPPAQVIQWNPSMPSPSGIRHWESGLYKPTAKIGFRGGFNAQGETGDIINFGEIYIADSGFYTDTIVLTMNMGEVNKHPDSFFDSAVGIATNFKQFNLRFWLHNIDSIAQYNPIFYYLQSAEWRRRFVLRPSFPGTLVVPSSMSDTQILFVRNDEIFMSGAYKDKEFSNFLYIVGLFPSGINPFVLGTYGGESMNNFVWRFSYDYTAINANVLPGDL